MMHQNGRKKLNLKSSHRVAMLRNQMIHFIRYGVLTTTKPRVKEVQRLIEKVITIARVGNEFNARRRVHALLPYDKEAVLTLFKDIAPKYVQRPGGYTRVRNLGQRMSDTAPIARLEWV
ncbi:MAG TPA: 50S ribosomal protein L17 [Patescibacteria group bacterium]|jgi:large subunit ribosomal protein L17|nr:50S ribosomal protein L17 [Patescibacteria group bacterium]